MRVLLDTQVFLWAITGDRRLKKAHRAVYLDEASDLYLSVASLWEIVIKAGLGKLPSPRPVIEYFVDQMRQNQVNPLAIRVPHLQELETLPPIHRDPFDRMIVAQARAERIPVLTVDLRVKKYGIPTL